jgi:hypothetical protein
MARALRARLSPCALRLPKDLFLKPECEVHEVAHTQGHTHWRHVETGASEFASLAANRSSTVHELIARSLVALSF